VRRGPAIDVREVSAINVTTTSRTINGTADTETSASLPLLATYHGLRRHPSSRDGLARRPGHPLGGGATGRHPLRPRPRQRLYAARRGPLQNRRPRQELCSVSALPPHPVAARAAAVAIDLVQADGSSSVYVCDIDRVPDFNTMYELYDPCSILFFWRNKHMVRPRPVTDSLLIPRLTPVSDVRLWDRRQQQAQLGTGGQTGAHRHRRDYLPRGKERPRSGCQPEGYVSSRSSSPSLLGTASANLNLQTTPLDIDTSLPTRDWTTRRKNWKLSKCTDLHRSMRLQTGRWERAKQSLGLVSLNQEPFLLDPNDANALSSSRDIVILLSSPEVRRLPKKPLPVITKEAGSVQTVFLRRCSCFPSHLPRNHMHCHYRHGSAS